MLQNFKKISNPLTIIAIFAGLAEIASTAALVGVEKEIQHIFIWFVMIFPLFLVSLFFLTLNYNSSVLYAPSDFNNDDSFIEVLRGKRSVENNFLNLEEEVNRLSTLIDDAMQKGTNGITEAHKQEIKETIKDEIDSIKARVYVTKKATEFLSAHALPRSELQARIIKMLSESDGQKLSATKIAENVNMSRDSVYRAIHKLVERGAIVKENDTFSVP